MQNYSQKRVIMEQQVFSNISKLAKDVVGRHALGQLALNNYLERQNLQNYGY